MSQRQYSEFSSISGAGLEPVARATTTSATYWSRFSLRLVMLAAALFPLSPPQLCWLIQEGVLSTQAVTDISSLVSPLAIWG
jgi:hypothetical protein